VLRIQGAVTPGRVADRPGLEVPGGYGDPVLTRRRLGQGTFSALILDAYGRKCAVTGEGYVTVTPEYRVEASAHMREDFNDGENYLRLHGSRILLPGDGPTAISLTSISTMASKSRVKPTAANHRHDAPHIDARTLRIGLVTCPLPARRRVRE
jgi:hypothetical protein